MYVLSGVSGAKVSWGSMFGFSILRTKKGNMFVKKRVKPIRIMSQKRIDADDNFRIAVLLWQNVKNTEYEKFFKEISKKYGYCCAYFCFVGQVINRIKQVGYMQTEYEIINRILPVGLTINKNKINSRNRNLSDKVMKNKIEIKLMNKIEIYKNKNIVDNTDAFIDIQNNTPVNDIDYLESIQAIIKII